MRPVSPLPCIKEADMEDQDHVGGDAVQRKQLRDADLRRAVIAHYLGPEFEHACPGAFAELLKALETSSADEIEVLRGRRIR